MRLNPLFETPARRDDGKDYVIPDWDNPPPYEEILQFLANADEDDIRPWALCLWKRFRPGHKAASQAGTLNPSRS